MGTSGSSPDVTREDTLGVFSGLAEPHTPLTTGDVANTLECNEQIAERKLTTLADDGVVRSRQVGDGLRVWWRPADADRTVGHRSTLAEFGAFVNAVEDYAIFTLDADGTVASWNDGARRIKGYSTDEIVGEHFSTFYTEEDVAAGVPEANLETAAERGQAEDEGWRVRADGSRFWADVRITAIRDEDGELVGFTKVTRDKTEQREFEQRLRRERDLTEQVLETVPVSISVIGADGQFVRANQQTMDRLGIDEENLTNVDVDSWDLYDEDGTPIPVAERPWQRALDAGEPVTGFECQVDLPSLGRRWLSVNAAPLGDDEGEDASEGADRVVITVDDVTDQKERERQLRRERDQTEQLLRTAPVGIAVQNADRETLVANERAQEDIGLSEQEFLQDPVEDGEWTIYDADGDRLEPDETPSARVLDREAPVFDEHIVMESPDGERIHYRMNAAPLFGDDGDVERVVLAGEDITELKRHERRLEREKSELETELGEIFERVSDAFYALDDEWRFTHLNERAAEIMGRPREELLGQKVWDVYPDARDGIYGEQFDRAMETQEPVTFETDDGDGAWLEFNAYPSESGLSVYFRDVTDRKERERELERTERRFEAVFEDPNILVGLLEPDGTVLDINETAMEYVDADLESIRGDLFWETPWWGEDDDARADVREWTERAAAGEYVNFQADLTRPDGERYTLEGVFRPVTDDDGDVVSIIVSDRDVTERREYERELEESERRYRALVENFPNGAVALVDADLHYQTVGGSPTDVADRTVDEVEGGYVGDVLPDELADELLPRYEAALRGERGEFEADVGDRVYQFQVVPVRDTAGDILAALGMSQDITDQKRRERELTRYETIVETVSDGIYVKDDDGYFTMVNDAYAELTGYDRDELLGAHSSLVVDEEAIAQSRQFERKRDQGENPTMEATLETADGGEVPAEATFTTFETGDGRLNHVGVVRDISERLAQRRRVEESERRHRTLVENFPNGAVGLFDENLEYTAVGGQLLDRLGLSPEERIGKSLDEIHPSDLLAEIGHHFEAALDGEAAEFEVEYRERYLHAHTLPVRDANDEVFAGMLVVQDVTERREAQRELRESEAKLRMLTENLEEVVWMASPEGDEFRYVNPAVTDVWGLEPEELYEDPLAFLDAVHPEDRERIQAAFEAIPETPFDEEFRVVTDDGVKWVHARGARVHDEDSGMDRVIGVGEDVTERKRRERRLEESERRYRTLAENFPNGAVSIYDADLRFTLSQGAVLGEELPPREEIEGKTAHEVYPQEILDDLVPLLRAAVEDGETDSDTFEFGGRHWRVYATPLRDGDDDIFSGLSFAQDITDQVEREAELERALDLLEKTERIADVGGWEIDPATEDVFWTDHVFELLRVPEDEEPPLEDALDMYHEDDRPKVEAAIDEAIASGSPFDVEVRLRTVASDDVRWLRLQGAPEIVDGEVVTLRGAAQDVTERKRREQRLEELVDRLEESNERLEQFAYAASHDLQEPLRMVSSYLRLIEQRYADELDADGEEFIEYAVDGADRMRDMIEGLLEYSRVDTRGDPFEPVDLDDVLADVREDLQVRIDETDADIDADDLPVVEGDGGQLRQVFQNLLDNAIEYAGDDPPEIHVSAERRGVLASDAGGGSSDEWSEADGGWWAVSVRDEGIGIDPEDAERVFEVFQSLHAPDDHSGTGIGLALCERIVERHGGDIWVDSEPGEGATFTVTLPAAGESDA